MEDGSDYIETLFFTGLPSFFYLDDVLSLVKQSNIHYIEEGKPVAKKHIVTVNTASLQKTVTTGGCGECQTSCQSACKTSCTVGNQVCEK